MNKLLFLIAWIGVSQSIFVLGQTNPEKKKIEALEKKKIEFLFGEMNQLSGARFWRNGVYYTPQEAVEYLRMKMEWINNEKKRPIKTAREFIERVASASTMSRKPYQIYFENGTKMEMSVFLYQKLSEWKE